MVDSPDRYRAFLVVLAITAGMLSVGGLLLPTGPDVLDGGPLMDEPDGEELIDEGIAARSAAERVVGEQRIEMRREGVTYTERRAVTERPGSAMRIEVRESTFDGRDPGDVIVENRSATMRYDADEGTVERRLRTDVRTTDDELNELDTLRSKYELSYRGTEELNATTAHVVEATPVTDAGMRHAIRLVVGNETYELSTGGLTDPEANGRETPASVTRTVWIDTDTGYPVKERTAMWIDDEADAPDAFVEREYERIDLRESLDGDPFTFEPPPGAEVVDVGPDRVERFGSRSAAVAATDLPVPLPAPDVPDGYERDVVVVSEEHGETTVTQWFTNESEAEPTLYVERSTAGYDLVRTDWTATTVRGAEGYRGERRGFAFLGWACDDGAVEIGHATDRGVVTETSETVRCGADG